jgi:hypothetical protein
MPDEEDDEPLPSDQVTVDAASPAGLKQQRRTQKRIAEDAKDFWKRVFATPVGRHEIWNILNNDMHAFTTIFAAGPTGVPDPNAAWYRLGEQNLGLILYHRWMAIDPEGVRLMHIENDPRFAKPKAPRKSSDV